MKDEDFEFLFINDGSKDNTLKIIKDLVKQDERVRFVSFSRNFGKNLSTFRILCTLAIHNIFKLYIIIISII